VDIFNFVGLLIITGSLGGIAKVLSDISQTLKRIEERLSEEK
jgi:hypothetical protein